MSSRYAIIKRGSKPEKTVGKEVYPKIDVGHVKGNIVSMAFCYLPDGCKVLFGDNEKIEEYIKKTYNTCCHAMVKNFSSRLTLRQIAHPPSFSILGKNSIRYYLRQGTKQFLSKKLGRHRSKFPNLDMPDNNHRYWVLLDVGDIADRCNDKPGYPRVLGYWRRVPKVYLRQFKDVDKVMPKEMPLQSVKTSSFHGRDASDIPNVLSDSAIRFLNKFYNDHKEE
jgi:hypothetical protein